MLKTLFEKVLRTVMVRDRLRVTFPDGTTRAYGPEGGETVAFTIQTDAALRLMCLNPELGLGEGYMDGTISLNNTTLDDLLRVLVVNRAEGGVPVWLDLSNRARFHMRRFIQRNTPKRARANVAHH
jgi:cyclopropane-fatty-acyl-phospholipid synthase